MKDVEIGLAGVDPAAAVALSPGLDYKGLRPRDCMVAVDKLFFAEDGSIEPVTPSGGLEF